jgi:hypothetical protein
MVDGGLAGRAGRLGLQVGAPAPLSIVRAVISGGLEFGAIFAERFFRFQIGAGSRWASSSQRWGSRSWDPRPLPL